MSTRVHELAKKLGLKSQELIDAIQEAGLDVRPSPLAGLDSDMVEKIERLYTSRPSSAAAPSPTLRPSHTPDRVEPAIKSESPKPERPIPDHPKVSAPRMSSGTEPSTIPGEPVVAVPPVETSAQPTTQADSIEATPAATPGPNRLTCRPTPAAPLIGQQPPRAAGGGPLASHTRPANAAPAARGSGPLSAHTQRVPTGPSSAQRPNRADAPPSAGNVAQGPLRRSDYISPTGTGPAANATRQTPPPSAPRRPMEPGGRPPEGPGPARINRPLPPVANLPTGPTGGIRRPSTAPRPTGPEERTQRPDVKYTPAQLLEMAKAGRLPGSTPQAPPTGPRPTGPAAGSGGRPMGPASQRTGTLGGPIPTGPAAGVPAPMIDEEEDRGRGHHGRGAGGANAGREQRRADRSKKATDRKSIGSPLPASALLDEDDSPGLRRSQRSGNKLKRHIIAPRKSEAFVEPPVTVRALSEGIGIKATDLVKKLFLQGNLGVNINSTLDDDVAMELALEFGISLTIVHERTAEDELLESFEPRDEDESAMSLRPPVITVLGHVDHGKTSLLDRIRKANVVASESGGITQHIGAYQIQHQGRPITFVDTPGHEAFTSMRARGANVTDIVVLVVAADDGVMPQTIEAIAHAKAADVPVVVALNKIDLPNADSLSNINKIYGELAQQGLNPAEWGGDTEVIRTSTLTGQGFEELLTTLETLSELLELKTNADRPATGTCLEALISEGRGVVATVLVQDGTLRVGDVMVCGDGYGRVRALLNDQGQSVTEAGPSTPVEVSGLDSVPTAGEKFAVVEEISQAREIAETRRDRGRGAALTERQPLTLENVYTRMSEQKVKTLNLILKADVQGSIEALTKELEKLRNDEVPIRILLKAVGGITESDVTLAEASDAIIIGFRVAPDDRAMTQAEEKKIDLRRYDIIYQVTDEIKKAVEGMLVPDVKDVHLGRATVRQVFKITRIGTVAGCYVTQGTIERGAKARIIREGREIYKGTVEALKRFKDDVKEVRENYDCGIKISNYDDIKPDDTIEAFRTEIIRRTL